MGVHRKVLVLALASVVFSGCNCGPDPTVDGGPRPDAGAPTADSGALDAGGTDAGAVDAGGTDAGAMDAGGTDAGALDAGATDAGSIDAGSTDAGGVDAGSAPADAGAGDAGRLDAGAAADAGPGDGGTTTVGVCPPPTGIVLSAADAGLPAAGLVLWLRSDLGVATLDGGAVCRWEDVSGNGRHFVPGGAVLPQRLGLSFPPGAALVTFGPNSQLVRNDVLGLAPTQARTVAVASAISSTTARFSSFVQGLASTNWKYFGLDQNTFLTVGSREGAYVTANAYDSNRPTDGLPHGHVLSISSLAMGTMLPGALVYSIDRTQLTLTRTPGGNGPNGPGNNLVWDFAGADFTSIGSGMGNGVLVEVLVYDRELTGAERTAVEDRVSPTRPVD